MRHQIQDPAGEGGAHSNSHMYGFVFFKWAVAYSLSAWWRYTNVQYSLLYTSL